jgi:hypothetical protein
MLLPWPQNGLSGSRPREGFYDTAEPRETVPAAVALFVLADGEFRETVLCGANVGRDADTLASIAGSIAGTFRGARSVPPDWIEQVEASNPVKQRTLAEGLYRAILREVETARRRLEEIEVLT